MRQEIFEMELDRPPLAVGLKALSVGLPGPGEIFSAKIYVIRLVVADHIEFDAAPSTGVHDAEILGRIETHLDETAVVLEAHFAPHANGWTARDGVADQRPLRHAAHDAVGVMREVSQNPTPSGSRKKMRLLRKRTSRPSLTQNREIGHFLLLNAAS